MLHATFRRLAARKMRLLSTGIAIVLGIAFMAGTLVLTETIATSFETMSAGVDAGTDAYVRARPAPAPTERSASMGAEGSAGSEGHGMSAAPARPRLDAALVDAVAAVPGVAAAEPRVEGFAQITHRAGAPVARTAGMDQPVGMAWSSDERLSPFSVARGRAPASDGEVAVDNATADRLGVTPGDAVTVLTPTGPADVTVSGVVTLAGYDTPGGAAVVLFTPAAAQRHLAEPGRVDAVAVAAADGVDPDELVGRIRERVGDGTEVLTGDALAAERRDDLRRDLSFLNTFLLAFALVSLFVGAFLIYNTFSILVAQRGRETALLRALGASRRQVLISVLVEAGVVGLVAGGAGVAAGVGLAAAALAVLDAVGVEVPATGLAVTAGAVVLSMATGLVVSLVSAVLPARRATRVAPVAAMRDLSVDDAGRSRGRVVGGAVVMGVGLVLFVAGLVGGGGIAAVGAGAAVLFVGLAVLGPAFARPVAAVIGTPLPRWRGVPGAVARQNAMRNPTRTSTTAAALTIGVALVGFITVLASSAKASVAETVARGFAGDVVVEPAGMMTPGLPESLVADVERLPQTGSVVAVRATEAVVDGRRGRVVGADVPALVSLIDLGDVDGDLSRLDASAIAVSAGEAEARGVRPGDTVSVAAAGGEPVALTVAAVYAEGDLVGPYLMAEDTFGSLVPSRLVARVLVEAADGVDAGAARAAVEAATAAHPEAAVQDRRGYVEAQSSGIDEMLNLVYGLLALAVLIALIGIANTLALSVLERIRELGVLRAVGMTRRQVRAAVRWEAVIIALLGAGLGLAVGVTLGAAVARTLADQGITTLQVPGAAMAAIAGLAAAAGVMAAILPARRAAGLDLLRALAAD